MTDWVLLLRGVNVGGRNTLRMADLRALLEVLGWALGPSPRTQPSSPRQPGEEGLAAG